MPDTPSRPPDQPGAWPPLTMTLEQEWAIRDEAAGERVIALLAELDRTRDEWHAQRTRAEAAESRLAEALALADEALALANWTDDEYDENGGKVKADALRARRAALTGDAEQISSSASSSLTSRRSGTSRVDEEPQSRPPAPPCYAGTATVAQADGDAR